MGCCTTVSAEVERLSVEVWDKVSEYFVISASASSNTLSDSLAVTEVDLINVAVAASSAEVASVAAGLGAAAGGGAAFSSWVIFQGTVGGAVGLASLGGTTGAGSGAGAIGSGAGGVGVGAVLGEGVES